MAHNPEVAGSNPAPATKARGPFSNREGASGMWFANGFVHESSRFGSQPARTSVCPGSWIEPERVAGWQVSLGAQQVMGAVRGLASGLTRGVSLMAGGWLVPPHLVHAAGRQRDQAAPTPGTHCAGETMPLG